MANNFVHVKAEFPSEDDKQAEVAKTARLRTLRLAKEAADQEQSGREVAPPAPIRRGLAFSPTARRVS
jgi:hypothetical protein